MFSNHFKIAFRNLLRNKGFSAINIIGLSIGIASAILLFSIVNFELGFDKFHKKSDRIYTIVREMTTPDGSVEYTSGSPLAMIDGLKQDIPQFEKVVPVCGTIEPQVTVLGKDKNSSNNTVKFTEDKQGICVGKDFFEVFDYQWLIGTPKVLEEPNVVVLTKKYAEKYFGKYEDAVGQFLKINNQTIVRVAGILENAPLNTDFPVNLTFSYPTKRSKPENWGFGKFDDWGSTSSMDKIFVLLPQNFTTEKANQLLATFTKKHFKAKESNEKKTHTLTALANFHHDDRYGNFSDKTISKTKIYGIALVGILIILMACINFINISTAVASKRAKEVGVRKTLGSYKSQLINQFMTETVVLVLISIGFSLIIAYFALPLLSNLFDFPAELNPFKLPILWAFLAVLFAFVSLFSGVYPALILSSFSPLEAFTQKVKANWTKGISLRQGLIVFQFSIALMLMVGTIVNFRQMNFISQMDLGFQKEGVFTFPMDTEYKDRYKTFREKLNQIPEVSSVSFSNDEPSSENNWQTNFAYDNSPKDADFNTNMKFIDGYYVKTYGLKVLAGEPFAPTDTLRKFVVNETLLKKLGVKNPELAIGKMIKIGGWDSFPITAVVKDFQVGSAKDEVAPIVMTSSQKYFWKAGVKISSKNLTATVSKIEKVFNETFPEVVFNGKFYDETLQNYYKAENQLGLLYQIASIIAILIACLGVIGLVAFVAEQRVKEIGIRKVLGASIGSITTLISKDFIKLVFVSMFIAFPTAYYFMNEWLKNFVFKVEIEWWYFALAGGLALLITLLSVSYQSIKAALMNPVKSLKSE